MDRIIDAKLTEWQNSSTRKPLLIFGARQVGKTYSLETFGRRSFDNYLHLDFSRNPSLVTLFEQSLDPKRIVNAIEAYQRTTIHPEKTLLILDEIQLCEPALTSLKYFCEDAPEYCVAAAGSLLGVKLRQQGSFPVGKVDMLTMHPLNFQEYLWARGEHRMADLIAECTMSLERFPLHERAMDLVHEYFLVGGMPDVVSHFTTDEEQRTFSVSPSRQNYEAARMTQLQIDQAYVADIAKHAPSSEIPNILDVWHSIPSQLAKENKKFQYKAIRSGGRASRYESAINWLVAAAIVSKCTRVTEPIAPLRSFEDTASFKLFRADTGLVAASFDAMPEDIVPHDGKAARFRGALAENYTMQQFCAADVAPCYWGVPSKQEVDFIARNTAGDIIPIEVKSGGNVRANSLEFYRKKYDPPYVARISSKNFGSEKYVRSIPLYAASFYAEEFVKSPLFV